MMNIQNAFSRGQAGYAKLTLPLTVHAVTRAQQRGVNRTFLTACSSTVAMSTTTWAAKW